MTAPVIEGCEPFSVEGGPVGVLVLHGFTGSPFSVRGIAEAMANAGCSVEMPLLPGHGTALEDMLPTTFADWSGAAEAAYHQLASRVEKVVVAGLSMGGTLTCWLAERHPETAGIILVNPFVEPWPAEMIDGVAALADGGTDILEAIGSDISLEGVEERSYPGTPLRPLLSLLAGVEETSAGLSTITCPVLLFSSRNDHVVAPSNGEHLLAHVTGPVERIVLEESFHVATLDVDADLIVAHSVGFVEQLTS